jgi:hypothetical protein
MAEVVHAGFELLWLLRLKARAHDAQAIADPGTDLTVKGPIRHRSNGHPQGLDRLVEITKGA